MKKLLLLGMFALLSTTLFSCTADDETSEIRTAKKDIPLQKTQADAPPEGPGDQPIIISPPKK